MNQIALTVIIIAVAVITASAAITGTVVGALLVGIFAYLVQKRALDLGVKKEINRVREPRRGRPKKE
jgi:branched-subunit amino acid ABC-type transport system permease component